MNEQPQKNEVHNQGTIQGLNQGIYNSPITQNFYGHQDPSWSVPLLPIHDLCLENFGLGDDAAANFPYVIKPIQTIYEQALQILHDASQPSARTKRGLFISGEANSGKTRLALEALKHALPDWSLLSWNSYNTKEDLPPIQMLKQQHVVLFLDDLYEYVAADPAESSQSSQVRQYVGGMGAPLLASRSQELRNLIDRLLQQVPQLMIVATCRSEYCDRVRAALGKVLAKLQELHVPSFSTNQGSTQVRQIITAFQNVAQHEPERLHIKDWDGTLGSLVLGLSTKRDQYLALPEHLKAVLRAMKLLTYSWIFAYSERRLRTICTEVFVEQQFNNELLWRQAIDWLCTTQFLLTFMHEHDHEMWLTLRKNIYFEKVVVDYPGTHHQVRLKQDEGRLLQTFMSMKDTRASSQMALSLYYQGEYEAGLKIYEQLCLLDASDVFAWYNKGVHLYCLNRTEEALRVFGHVLQLEPSHVEACNNKGACLFQLGQHKAALQAFEQTLQIDPSYIVAILNKATYFDSLGHREKALLMCDEALQIDPFDIRALSSKADCLLLLERYEEALQIYEKILKLNPFYLPAHTHRADCLLQLKRYQEALQVYEKVLKIDASQAESWNNKGACLIALTRYNEALQAYEEALHINPTFAIAWRGKGDCLLALNRYKDALQTYEEIIELEPTNAMCWYNKGVCLDGLHRNAEAIQAYKESVKYDSNYAAAWYNQGVCLTQENRPKEALRAFDKALQIDPNDADIWTNKGYCLNCLHKYKEALQASEQALKLNPNLVNAWYHKGLSLGTLNRHEEALLAFEQALALDPNYAPAWLNKGIALAALGRHTEAQVAYGKAHSLDKGIDSPNNNLFKIGPTNNVYDTGHTIARQNELCKKKQQRKTQQQSRKANRKKR